MKKGTYFSGNESLFFAQKSKQNPPEIFASCVLCIFFRITVQSIRPVKSQLLLKPGIWL
jgi:hypothetical protein